MKTHANHLITQHLDTWTQATEAKSTAGRGTRGKINLLGIQKLRELILEMAVRGLLVPQDPNDEPASELLKKIAAEKAQLIKQGKIKKNKSLPEISEDEKPFDLPNGWDLAQLDEIGDWGAGSTPKRGNVDYYNGSIPWFKSGELVSDYVSKTEETISEKALKECSLRLNQPGDVLVAMYGATIGKTSILEVQGTTNQAVCACTTFSGMFNQFLLLLLKAYKTRFTDMGAGGAQPNISRIKIVSTVIALPPKNEQKRIVEKVDELMALCDQLESQTLDSMATHQTLVETLLGNLVNPENTTNFDQAWSILAQNFDVIFTTEHSIDTLKQTILQLAVMGKLVPQNPNDEPASKLLEKIFKEKAQLIQQGKLKKSKPLPEITEAEKPFDLPDGWEWVRLSELVTFENGDRSSRYPNQSDLKTEGIPFFGAKDMVKGELVIDNDLRFISEEKFSELSNGKLKDKDLVVLLRGTVGKIAQFNASNFETGFINAQMLIIRFVESELSSYFRKYFESKLFENQISEFITGSAIKQMPASKLESILVCIPPKEEQTRIVAKVNELMTLCDQLKTQLQNAQQTQIHLAQSIEYQIQTLKLN